MSDLGSRQQVRSTPLTIGRGTALVMALAVTVAATVITYAAATLDHVRVGLAVPVVPESLRVADNYAPGEENEDQLEQVLDGLLNLTTPYENYGGIDYNRDSKRLELWVRSSEWPTATRQQIREIAGYAKAIGMHLAFHEIVYSAAEFAPRAKEIVAAGRALGWTVVVEELGQNQFGVRGPEIAEDQEAEDAMLEIATRVLGRAVEIEMNPDD